MASPLAAVDEQDHGIAFPDVGGELFAERGRTLTKILMVADFKFFASQHPCDFRCNRI